MRTHLASQSSLRHNTLRTRLKVTDADFHSTPLGWAIYGSEHGWDCRNGNYPAVVELLLRGWIEGT